MIKKICFIFSIIFWQITIGASIHYEVKMSEPHTHYFEVSMIIENYTKDSIDITLPVWAPGSYLVRDFSKNVEELQAKSENTILKNQKINKNTWRIYSKKSKKTIISYKVYAFEMSVRTSFLDASHGYFNGTGVFMFIDELRNQPSTVSIYPYKGWEKVSTSLKKIDQNSFTYQASNYDELVDSPFEIGNHVTFSFEASGTTHHVAMYGEGNYNIEQLKKDMAKVCESATAVFDKNPSKEYTFIIHNLTNGSGGLEHSTSTTLQVNRWTYKEPDYKGFLSLVAHEYFHLWNVKRMKPSAFNVFDYNNENYTDLLWMMEGFTSYYDELLLYRAGFYTKDEILNKLVGSINNVENQPGNKVMSAADASFNAWIKAYKPDENNFNNTISYYSKGSVIAILMDLMITNATQGKKSLDDVMKHLYIEYYEKKQAGFNSNQVREAIKLVSGIDFTDFFNKYIFGTETPDYATVFKYANIELTEITNKRISIGINFDNNVITRVTRNTPAYNSGLNVNDEIIAVNGYRFNGDMSTFLHQKKSGDTLSILINRDNIMQTIQVPLTETSSKYYSISSDGDNQNVVFDKWLKKQ